MTAQQEILALRHDAPLTGLIVGSMLKDTKSFLAIRQKNDVDFVIRCEAAFIHDLCLNQQYLFDLESKKELLAAEYAAYVKAQEKKAHEVRQQPLSVSIKPYTLDTAKEIHFLMEALLKSIANLNQIKAGLFALSQHQQPLTYTFQGKTVELDLDSEQVNELIERKKNRLSAEAMLARSVPLQEKYREIQENYANELVAKGETKEEADKKAQNMAKTRFAQNHALGSTVVEEVGAARVLHQCVAEQSNESVHFTEVLRFVRGYFKIHQVNLVDAWQSAKEANDLAIQQQKEILTEALNQEQSQILALFKRYQEAKSISLYDTPGLLFKSYPVPAQIQANVDQECMLISNMNKFSK